MHADRLPVVPAWMRLLGLALPAALVAGGSR
jgi:hypothetical protein